MKKKILLAIIFFMGMFFPVIPVKALTTIHLDEQDNGKLKTSLDFEEGFVGAIDITFQINGNVAVKNFQFSNKIATSNYGKKYTYNSKKKTLTVRVTAGGISNNYNLLNAKKELDLGTMELKSSAKENTTYKITDASFTFVDNSWSSKTVENSNIRLENNQEFVYKVTNKTENNEETPKKEETNQGNVDNNNTTSDTNKNNSSSSSSNTNTTTSNSNQASGGGEKESSTNQDVETYSTTKEENDSTSGDTTEALDDDSLEQEEDTKDSDEETEILDDDDSFSSSNTPQPRSNQTDTLEDDKTSLNWIMIIGIGIGIIAVGGVVIAFVNKGKNKVPFE